MFSRREIFTSSPLIIAALAISALIIRLVVSTLGHFGYDKQAFTEWMLALRDHPLGVFYDLPLAVPQDHLPGTLWILIGLERIYAWTGTPAMVMDPATYWPIKWTAIIADVVAGFLIVLIVRQMAGSRVGYLAGAAYLFNPATIFISAFWGQWDAISLCFMLCSLLLILKQQYAFGFVSLAMSTLFKPQFAILAIPFAAYILVMNYRQRTPALPGRREWIASMWLLARSLVTGTLLSLMVVTVAGWPFGVALIPGISKWTYWDRVFVALERYPGTTFGALSVWLIPLGTGEPPSDHEKVLLGLSYVNLASLLIALTAALSIGILFRSERPEIGLVLSMCVVFWGSCVFGTRLHERYFLPAFALLIVSAAVAPRARILATVMSVVFFANTYIAFTFFDSSYPFSHLRSSAVISSLAAVAVVAWIIFAVMAWKESGRNIGVNGSPSELCMSSNQTVESQPVSKTLLHRSSPKSDEADGSSGQFDPTVHAPVPPPIR